MGVSFASAESPLETFHSCSCAFFSWIMEGVWWFVRYTIPVFYPTDALQGGHPGRRLARCGGSNILILALVLGGLWFAELLVRYPHVHTDGQPLRCVRSWLPLLFMLIYSLSCGWAGGCTSCSSQKRTCRHIRDIDRDWQEAGWVPFAKVGIDLSEVPLFLDVGQAGGWRRDVHAMPAAFTASQMPSPVR